MSGSINAFHDGFFLKTYYPAFDGLRGIAALSVAVYHCGQWLELPSLGQNAYLAVDTFFCLSGYVMPLSYAPERTPSLTIRTFLQIRLVRLMPLIALATLVSATYLLVRLNIKHQEGYIGELALATVLGIVTMPYFTAPQTIGGPQLFPLNGPQYTLFFELLINAIWFLVRTGPHIAIALPVFIIGLSGVALFGLGGDTGPSFLMGLPRIAASFSAGVLLYHCQSLPGFARVTRTVGRAFIPLCIAMTAIFFTPYAIGTIGLIVWIGLLSPLVVLGGTAYGGSRLVQRVCRGLGALSYPVYALHYPIFCWLNGLYRVTGHEHSGAEVPFIVGLVIGISAAALIFYDQPVRRWLSLMLKRQVQPRPQPSELRA